MTCPIFPHPAAAPTALPKVLAESDDDDPDANPDLEIKVGEGGLRVHAWVGGCVGGRAHRWPVRSWGAA